MLKGPIKYKINIKLLVTHLHEDLHSVQRGGSCAGHGSRNGPRHQLLPPQTRCLLLLRELIWDGQAVANIQNLVETHSLSLNLI